MGVRIRVKMGITELAQIPDRFGDVAATAAFMRS